MKSYDKLEKVKLFFSVNLYYYCLLLVIISFSVCHFKKTKFRFSQEKKLSEDNLKDMSSDLQVILPTHTRVCILMVMVG